MSTTATGVSIILPDGFVTNTSISSQAAIDPTKLAQQVLQVFPIPFTQARVWNTPTSLLPATAASDDLALIVGTWGTDSLLLSAGDLKAVGATTRYAVIPVVVPPNYQDGETIQIRVRAAVETTVADTSCTVDLECFKGDGTGAVGSDLVTTSATTINSLTPANVDFTLNPASVDPGDLIEVRIAITCTDAATGTAVTPTIYAVTLLCDTRG
jgi:hypothetical protein